MNILYVTHEKELGGATHSLLDMLDYISKENRVYVLMPCGNIVLKKELKKRGIAAWRSIYFAWMIVEPRTRIRKCIAITLYRCLNLFNFMNALILIPKIKRAKIDIIHTNSSVINMGAILSKYCCLPHVWHIREFGEEDFNYIKIFDEKKQYLWMNQNTDKFIAISKSIYQKFSETILKNKLVEIYNGVNTKNLFCKYDEDFTLEGNINILISGRLCEAKCQLFAITAMQVIKSRNIQDIKLFIAGNGDRNYENYLNDYVSKHGLEQYVYFLGYCNRLNEVRKKMHIELICSRQEGFGRVTIEAMMSSNPVIGADTGGTAELISNGENGFLYKHGDLEDLVAKILILREHREKIVAMGRYAYKFSQNFTSQKNAKKILALYETIFSHMNGRLT